MPTTIHTQGTPR